MKRKSDRYYQNIYRLVRPFVGLWAATKFRYTNAPLKLKEPFIIMSNHLTEIDFYILMGAMRNHMYFVCSEHLFRGNFPQKMMVRLFNPIALRKGTVSSATVIEILRRVREGNNIMIFPEGNRSFNGVTEQVDEATGKLVQRAGCTLVTFRMSGGYFVAPRWSAKFRKGDMWGGVVGVYSPQELAKMTPAEITQRINEDLFEDAYARQLKFPRRYTGEALASGIENYLFLCPKCGGFSTLHSSGDRFWCDCGLAGRYDEYAMLHGDGFDFKTVRDWGAWQKEEFDRLYHEVWTNETLFCDEDVTLYRITQEHARVACMHGTLKADKTGFSIENERFDFAHVQAMEYINLGNTILFQSKGQYWDMTRTGLCGVKYRMLWTRATGRHD